MKKLAIIAFVFLLLGAAVIVFILLIKSGRLDEQDTDKGGTTGKKVKSAVTTTSVVTPSKSVVLPKRPADERIETAFRKIESLGNPTFNIRTAAPYAFTLQKEYLFPKAKMKNWEQVTRTKLEWDYPDAKVITIKEITSLRIVISRDFDKIESVGIVVNAKVDDKEGIANLIAHLGWSGSTSADQADEIIDYVEQVIGRRIEIDAPSSFSPAPSKSVTILHKGP